MPAALAIVLIGAGCGSNAPSGTGTAAGTASSSAVGTGSASPARRKAVKFAECMRANGVGDFPDPNASGELPSFGISVSKAKWSAAVAACKELQPPGSLNATMTPAEQSAAIRFAQCMRKNGVKDFPDPVNGQPLIDTTRIPSANRAGGMAILNAAGDKCRALIEAAMAGRR